MMDYMIPLVVEDKRIFDVGLSDDFRRFIFEARGRNRIIDPQPNLLDIKNAIVKRQYVGFYYKDESDLVLNGFRLIEPYLFGNGYRFGDGTVNHIDRSYLRAYIIKSSKEENLKINRNSVSLSNRENGWRMFRLDRISDWFTFSYKFSKFRDGYEPDDKHIANKQYYLQHSDFPRGKKATP